MRHVVASNYPRSGYHLVVDILVNAVPGFKRSANYAGCTINGKGAIGLDHDHHLTNPIKHDQAYLVQYRHPLMSIASWLELHNPKKADIPVIWNRFLPEKLEFWKKHVMKWYVSSLEHPYSIVVLYEDLVSEPVAEMMRVIRLLGVDVKEDTVRAAVEKVGIRVKRNVQNTPYIRPKDVKYVNDIARNEMATLGITDELAGVHL